MRKMLKNEKGFASLAEIVLVLAVLMLLSYFAMNTFFNQPNVDPHVKNELKDEGIDASKPLLGVDAAKTKVDEMNKRTHELEDQYKNLE